MHLQVMHLQEMNLQEMHLQAVHLQVMYLQAMHPRIVSLRLGLKLQGGGAPSRDSNQTNFKLI
jgi:hypothetical protein